MGSSRPIFFESAVAFRAWLEAHHARARELWVGFHNLRSRRRRITYSEALDEALCFGWIDGVRRSVSETRYVQRFTPRRERSLWSAVNVARVRRLIVAGRMHPAGLAAFEARDPHRSSGAARDAAPGFDAASARRFRAAKRAWRFFTSQPPGYRRLATRYVTSAKRDETRRRRLEALIESSARGARLPQVVGAPAGSQRTERRRSV